MEGGRMIFTESQSSVEEDFEKKLRSVLAEIGYINLTDDDINDFMDSFPVKQKWLARHEGIRAMIEFSTRRVLKGKRFGGDNG